MTEGVGTWGESSRSQHCQQLASATRKQLRLLEVQRQLEQGTRDVEPPSKGHKDPDGGNGSGSNLDRRFCFVDQPCNETVYQCFCNGQDATAEQLLVEFKLPERRWTRLKLKGLAHAHRWEALWQMSQAKKLPVPLAKFAEACAEHGAIGEASRYARRLAAADSVPLLLRLGRIDEARQCAIGHPELLKQLAAFVY